MSADRTYIIITGANRGLGLQFTKTYASRTNHMIIASARDPASAANTFTPIPTASGTSILPVAFDTTSEASGKQMMAELESKHSIPRLDLVITNAGMTNCYATDFEAPIEQYNSLSGVNALGVVVTYQAVHGLFTKGKTPKFVGLSRVMGSIEDEAKYQFPKAVYGSANAAANFIVKKIHFEEPGLVAFSISPGWAQTHGGNFGAKTFGMEATPMTVEESVDGMVDKIDKATRETTRVASCHTMAAKSLGKAEEMA